MKNHHRVVVVGAGLGGNSLARAFANEFAGTDDTVLTVDAFAKPEVSDIGSPDSHMRAGPGLWQRHSELTTEPAMAKKSREIYEALNSLAGDIPVFTPQYDITVGTKDESGTVLQVFAEMAEQQGLTYYREKYKTADEYTPRPIAEQIHPDYAEYFMTLVESPETAGIIHINSAIDAMQQEVLKRNEENEFIYNFEVNLDNTVWDEAEQVWRMTLDDGRVITTDHVVFAPGAKSVIDILEGKNVHQFVEKPVAKLMFSPQRAPVFIYYFPDGHGLTNLSFTTRDNTNITDAMFGHPDGKHLYCARFSDPANPLDKLEQRLGADHVTAVDKKIFEQRLSLVKPELAEQIRDGRAQLVQECVYRYTTSYTGKPVSHVRKETNGASFSYLVGEGGGWAKKMPVLAEEHARQVLGKELQFPEEMAALTTDFPRYFGMIKAQKKAGVHAKKNPVVAEPDMYGFERMLNQILKIDAEFQYRTADDSMVRQLFSVIDAVPQIQEFFTINQGIHQTLPEPAIEVQRNLTQFLKNDRDRTNTEGKQKVTEQTFYNLLATDLRKKFRELLKKEVNTDSKDVKLLLEHVKLIGKGLETYIDQTGEENNLLKVDDVVGMWGGVGVKMEQSLRQKQAMRNMDKEQVVKYTAGQILFEAAMLACIDRFVAKYPQMRFSFNGSGAAAGGPARK